LSWRFSIRLVLGLVHRFFLGQRKVSLDGPVVIRVILEQLNKQVILTVLEIFLQVLTVANDALVAALGSLLD
jgi:hypothetical protein